MDSGRKLKKHLSDSDPRDLIREIKCRPGLYDKDKLEQPKRENKQQLWMEVAENLIPNEIWECYDEQEKEMRVNEIQIKWKHLRNHFLREVKLIKSGKAHTKRKYKYYDDMEFMCPFVGVKQYTHKSKEKSGDTTTDGSDEDDVDNDVNQSLNSSEEVHEKTQDIQSPRRSIRVPLKKQAARESISPPGELTKEQKQVINNFDNLKKISQKIRPSNAPMTLKNPLPASMRDGDISFCLSLVPTMRKLDESKRLKAKIDILTVLQGYIDETTLPAKKKKHSANGNGTNKNREEQNSEHIFEVDVKNENSSDRNMDNIWWT
ncbi:uncharacterized protein [Musca autumnalis]|uniref:uncharacterized protein n=1 Tax=Musca autumnalis TaxID=221902 RepID=UPI003CE841C6